MQSNEYQRKSDVVAFLSDNTEKLNVTTIDDDCMQLIFEYLEWKDLLNVAETCKAFHTAACSVFKRKYSGDKMVEIGVIPRESCYWLENNRWLEEVTKRKWNPPLIIARTQLMALKLLRNFGHTISNLFIYSSVFDQIFYNKYVEFYLVEYCWQSLKQLLLIRCNLRLIDLKKPFINLETIFVKDCYVDDDLPFIINFPKLKSLAIISNVYVKKFTKMAIHIPSLTHLKFEERAHQCYNYYPYKTFSEESEIIDLIKLNSQIEHFDLTVGKHHSRALLQSVTEYLPKLRHLIVHNRDSHFFDNAQNVQHLFYSESVEHFDLVNTGLYGISHIPFIFPNLKSLIIIVGVHFKPLSSFFAKHKELKSIEIDAVVDEKNFKYEDISSNIEELTIRSHDLGQMIDVMFFRFLKEKYKLKKFSMKGYIRRNFNESYQILCDAMTLNEIEFEVKIIEKISKITIEKISKRTTELHVKKLSNLSKMQNIIKISESYDIFSYLPEWTDIQFYTING